MMGILLFKKAIANIGGIYMTDKITTEAATIWLEVEIKRILHEVHTDDLKSTIEVNSRVTALELAIEALEYREPKKPTHKDTLHSSCPICGEDAKVFWKFCPHCGQRLDWSDEE